MGRGGGWGLVFCWQLSSAQPQLKPHFPIPQGGFWYLLPEPLGLTGQEGWHGARRWGPGLGRLFRSEDEIKREEESASLVLLQRELCARPGARTAPPAPSCCRRRRWARPPGRGSGPRRQLLPASRTSSPPRSGSGPESRPRVPVESSPSPPSPSRHPPHPAARSRPPQNPRRPCASPAMLSFQYPDVYRDETAVSTQLRLAHDPPPAALHPLRSLTPCSPLPHGLCLRDPAGGARPLPRRGGPGGRHPPPAGGGAGGQPPLDHFPRYRGQGRTLRWAWAS